MYYFNNKFTELILPLKIINKESQFIIPIFLCLFFYFIINIKGLFNISDLSYYSSLIIKEPHRIIIYGFVHKDFNHLLSNLFGIIVVRYCFLNLNLNNKYLFLYLIIFLIPIQTLFLLTLDNFILINSRNFLVGFSGVLFGAYTFIFFSSLLGKKFFFNMFIGLEKSSEIKKLMILCLSLGLIYSFLPSISLSAHLAGILSGFIIFFI